MTAALTPYQGTPYISYNFRSAITQLGTNSALLPCPRLREAGTVPNSTAYPPEGSPPRRVSSLHGYHKAIKKALAAEWVKAALTPYRGPPYIRYNFRSAITQLGTNFSPPLSTPQRGKHGAERYGPPVGESPFARGIPVCAGELVSSAE